MSKLTFRADDDLVERVERLDASKSEVMREALRAYLDGPGYDRGHDHAEPGASAPRGTGSLDAIVDERVETLLDRRLGRESREVNVNITVESAAPTEATVESDAEETPADARVSSTDRDEPSTPEERAATDTECAQCGATVDPDHVYCPNCGEKRSRRVFCECGDEIRTDWSFCPSCGRRTPAADVLEQS